MRRLSAPQSREQKLIRKILVGLTGDADANITYESVDCNGRLSAWAERQCRLCVGLISVGFFRWQQSVILDQSLK